MPVDPSADGAAKRRSLDPGDLWCVLASHDRCETTLTCLASVTAQTGDVPAVRILLVDDGSTDGTAEAVRARFPDVEIVTGDGDLYWAGGMRLGIDTAVARGAHTLWLVNDDAVLDPDALYRSLTVAEEWHHRTGVRPWVVGSMRSPDDGSTTYGGWSRRWHVLVRLIPAPVEATRCATTSCNSLVVPVDQYLAVGGLDPRFPHLRADHDLGYRASKAGVHLVIAPGHLGTCAANGRSPWQDPVTPLRARLRDLHSPKWYPPALSLRYTLRHYGPIGLASFVRPYVLVVATASTHRVRRGVRWLSGAGRSRRRGARR